MPLQDPLQPAKVLVAPEVGVSVTTVPTANSAVQVPLATPPVTVQTIPPGVLWTEPLPLPFGEMTIA
ncbi:hypothetical protein D3C83_72800 [compost metagenome]